MSTGDVVATAWEQLSPFAQEVAACVLRGEPFGTSELPAEDDPRSIPGSLVRDLALGALGPLAEPEIRIRGVVVEGDVDLAYCEWRGGLDLGWCRVRGTVDLAHAVVRGRVCLDDADVDALQIHYALIDGPLYFRRGHCRQGLYGLAVHVTGSLNLRGTRVVAPEQKASRCALELFRARLGDLFLGGTELIGGVYANGMTVDRNVRLQSARVVSRSALGWSTSSEVDGLSLVGATIGAALYLSWRDPSKPPLRIEGHLRLTRLTCVTLRVRRSEIAHVPLLVAHLTYTRLVGITPEEWLAELERTPRTGSQPYVRLAAYCTELGRTDLQRTVLIALQRRITSELPRRSPERWRRRLWEWTVGYGYRAGRSLLWLVACTLLCVLVLLVGGDFLVQHAPPAPDVRGVADAADAATVAMDNVLPFAGLGVASQWSADPTTTAQTAWLALFVGLKLLGWGMAALGLASVTGIAKKP